MSGDGDAYLYSKIRAEWTKCDRMPTEGRRFYACGVVTSEDENGDEDDIEIVVAGGRNATGALATADIYSLKQSSWRSGPSLPHPIENAASVPFGDTFLIVGGMSEAKYLDTIFRYDAENAAWALLDASLSEARVNAVAMMVDRALFHENLQLTSG